ncbi:MAG: hypothetical protein V3V50_05715 [Gammaproteobacteria bacterium]
MKDGSMLEAAGNLTVVVNGDSVLEYDRGKELPIHQQSYLNRMDTQMDAGVMLGGQYFQAPDQLQRAQFVAVNLVEALQQDNEPLTAASCAYLAARIPELKQIKAELNDEGMQVDLVFDSAYSKEVRVELGMPSSSRKH